MAYSTASPAKVPLIIERLSRGGDGVVTLNGEKIYVPLSAPGDIIHSEGIARHQHRAIANISHIITPSDVRAAPPCPHYGTCGGCRLQHIDETSYRAFKDNIALRTAESCGGTQDNITPSIYGAYNRRRRAMFTVSLDKHKHASLSFYARAASEVVPIDVCMVCTPALNALIPICATAVNTLKKPGVIDNISIDIRDEGADIVFVSKRTLKASEATALTKFFTEQDAVSRMSIMHADTDTKKPVTPVVLLSRVHIDAAPGSFLQPTQEGAAALRAAVSEASAGARKVIDLYSGGGHYALDLAERGIHVCAYEGDADMIRGIHNSAVTRNLTSYIDAFTRDLHTYPVPAEHIKGADIVVINPPRNGALPQCKQIRANDVPRVVMLSCNPSAFTRDAQQLIRNGYRLTSMTMIDQFYRSPHIELAAVFDKAS